MAPKKPAHAPRVDPSPAAKDPTNRPNYTTAPPHAEGLIWFHAGFKPGKFPGNHKDNPGYCILNIVCSRYVLSLLWAIQDMTSL